MNWHSLPVEEIASVLNTDLSSGLSESEAHRRLKEKGMNELPQPRTLTKTQIFLSQFQNPLIMVLVVAGAITIFLRDLSDTIIIFSTVMINTLVGYFQESKTSKILEALKRVIRTKALVKRDGEEREIPQENLTQGDVIILKAGLKAPADARLIYANELRVNESALTGEWLPVEKDTRPVPVDSSVADRHSLVHMGTIIESGEGEAVVIGTGGETEIGRIAEATERTKEEKTPYQKKLDKFSKIIGSIVVGVVLLIFLEGVAVGRDPQEMFLISVAVAVAAIPEGLPVAMSVILAVGSQQILKKKGLVRRLASAETLGNTNVILMDKTGTLTEAKMKVSSIFSGDGIFGDDAEQPDKELSAAAKSALKSAVLSSEAFIENFEGPVEKWIIRGRPTEKAIVEAGIKAGIIKREIEEREPRVAEIIFSAEWRYSAALHESEGNKKTVYSMGAPEAIIDKISAIETSEGVRRVTKEEVALMIEKANALSATGSRILATARKEIGDHENEIDRDLSDMIFTGLLVFSDPIRGDVGRALASCRQAGIMPIIVTGDNAFTAKSIANSLGFEASDENIMEGSELEKISDADLLRRIEEIKIFARVAPVQKSRIVAAWQKKGRIVAMTGDGVNDAPAIKKADIGIALGSGTDAAKEAADFILLDDSFVVIETAIEEGRKILDNIKKVITYLLSGSFSETLLISIALLLGLPIPVTAAQILWVNLIEDGLPSIALAFEPKEKGIMSRRPNAKAGSLITREMKVIIFVIGILTDLILVGIFISLTGKEISLDVMRTVIFALLAVNSLLYSFSCKNLRKNIWQIDVFSNGLLVFGFIFGVAALVTAIYLPALNTILGTVPIDISFWPLILGFSVINVIFIEIAKYYFIRKKLTE